MAHPIITGTGHLGADPELRFTPSGKAVANLRIACTERKRTPSGEWEDGTTTWLNVAVWGHLAETVTEHLRKGSLVHVVGRLSQREHEGKVYYDVTATEVTQALPRPGQQERRQEPQQGQGRGNQRQDDPWTSQPPTNDPWGQSGGNAEPPF